MIKTVFIDRDGVINKDPGGWTEHNYVTELRDFHFLPGALEALALLNKNKYRVIIISNQAGVSKGYFSRSRLDDITKKMLSDVNNNGGRIEDVFYCLHKNEDNCDCRKPKAGLFDMAAKKYVISRNDTYMIGDSDRDIISARRAGLRTIVVLSGKTKETDVKGLAEKPDLIFKDLISAVRWMVEKNKRRLERSRKRK